MSSYVVLLIHDIAIHNFPCTLEIFFIKDTAYPIPMGLFALLPRDFLVILWTMYNNWLQHSCNKMTCLYKTTMDELIKTFMQIVNYTLSLKEGVFFWVKALI